MANPYASLLKTMQQEGSALNSPDMELGEVQAMSPLSVLVSGTLLTEDIYCLEGVTIQKGDAVAVQRIGEITLVLGKVVEA